MFRFYAAAKALNQYYRISVKVDIVSFIIKSKEFSLMRPTFLQRKHVVFDVW